MIAVLSQKLGYFVLGGMFVLAGLRHFLDFETAKAPLERRQYPSPGLLLGTGSLVELCAGGCLAAGWGRPWAAVALIAFTIVASLMFIDFWNFTGTQRQEVHAAFVLNVAVVGGLLIAATA
jgi:putative oxidoreductase